MVKRVASLVLVVLFLISLVGCTQQTATTDSAPAAAGGKPFAGQTLRVAFWGGTFQSRFHEAVGKAFEESTGAKIEYINGNPSDHLAKLVAAKGQEAPFDVVGLDDGTQSLAAVRDLLEPFDASRVPNAQNVFPEATTVKGHAPGFFFIQVGIAYNVEKFKELGIPAPTSWDILWHPKLEGRVAIPGLTVSMGPFTLAGVSKLEGGSERNIDPGLDRLSSIKLHSVYTSSTDLEAQILAGEVWAAAWIDGRVGTINAKKPGLMKFVHPKMGDKVGTIGTDTLNVVKGTKNREMADALINQSLDVDTQVKLAKSFLFSPTRPEAGEQLRKSGDVADYMVLDPAEAKDRYVPDWAYINTVYEQWLEKWNRTMKK